MYMYTSCSKQFSIKISRFLRFQRKKTRAQIYIHLIQLQYYSAVSAPSTAPKTDLWQCSVCSVDNDRLAGDICQMCGGERIPRGDDDDDESTSTAVGALSRNSAPNGPCNAQCAHLAIMNLREKRVRCVMVSATLQMVAAAESTFLAALKTDADVADNGDVSISAQHALQCNRLYVHFASREGSNKLRLSSQPDRVNTCLRKVCNRHDEINLYSLSSFT